MALQRLLCPFVSVDSETSFTIQRLDPPGYSLRVITLDDGRHFPTGDATATDLLQEILDKMDAFAELAGKVALTINPDTGVISIAAIGATVTHTITWGATGTRLRDWLRLPENATLVLTDTPTVGSTAVTASLHPGKLISLDLRRFEADNNALLSTSGRLQVISHPTPKRIFRGRILVEGAHREDVAKEVHAAVDFWDYASIPLEFRLYRDRSIATAWVEFDNPRGYETFWMHEDDHFWEDIPLVNNWYGFYERIFKMREFVA